MSRITKNNTFSYILNMLKPFSFSIGIMLWVAIVWAIDLSIRPYLLKLIINKAAESNSEIFLQNIIYPICFYLFMSFLIPTSFRLYDYFVNIKMIPDLRNKIANHAVEHLLTKSHKFYQNNFSGSLSNKINDLVNYVPQILQITIDRFLSHSLALIIAIYTLWQVNFTFALFMLSWTLVFFIGSYISSKKLANYSKEWSEISSTITGKFVDAFSNILSIRLFSNRSYEREYINLSCKEATQAERNVEWAFFKLWLCYGYSFFLLQCLNIFYLIKGRSEGWISVGDFALVLAINLSIVDCMWNVAKEFSQFSRLLGKITQGLKPILETPEIIDEPDAKELVVTNGEIIFDKVKFHYKDANALFEDKSVVIKAGEKVGLVGYSGSGKTTFANLILRIYDINKGKISIDGQDISKVTQDSLRRAIAMIPQDASLFHRTIMENIRYGNLDASNEEVILAAKKAHAHEFIMNNQDGYNALVGERGIKVSGGQRQRISIARAILKNAPILILDEATSQLDSLTESYIQESLSKLMKDKTTLVIAHRLSTLLNMDRILVFNKGVIIDDGTHEELISKKGLYATLWNSQVDGFIPEKLED